MTRQVILLCGPAGAGKTTLARATGLPIYDRDDPQWASEHDFTNAITQLKHGHNTQAVIIRSGATLNARQRTIRLTRATHTYIVIADANTCRQRIKTRARHDWIAGTASVATWFLRYQPHPDHTETTSDEGIPHMSAPRHRYGSAHQRKRAWWKPQVERGDITCWRCGEKIHPNEPWDLGHAENSDSEYAGPEHIKCNRGAAGRKTAARPTQLRTSRRWVNKPR